MTMKLIELPPPDEYRRRYKSCQLFRSEGPLGSDNEYARIIVSWDLLLNGRKLHMSVSIGPRQGDAARRPTDAEMNEVHQLLRVQMNLLPQIVLEEDNAGGRDPNVRHLWQR
jgi:hypothetical protein